MKESFEKAFAFFFLLLNIYFCRVSRKTLRKRSTFIKPESTLISSEIDSESNNGAERATISLVNTKVKPTTSQITINTGKYLIIGKNFFCKKYLINFKIRYTFYISNVFF